MKDELTIRKVENGYIIKTAPLFGIQEYLFKTFDECIDWIKKIYDWK